MNRTFKVVFNKARGALTVVNEVTSSVQAKSAKSVMVATVLAVMAGGVCAQAAEVNGTVSGTDPVSWDNDTVIGENVVIDGATVTLNTSNAKNFFKSEGESNLTLESGTLIVTGAGAAREPDGDPRKSNLENNFTIKGGSLNVGNDDLKATSFYVGGKFTIADEAEVTVKGGVNDLYVNQGDKYWLFRTTIAGYNGFEMTGGELKLDGARAWVGSSNEGGYEPMVFSGGEVILANGGINGMVVKTDDSVEGSDGRYAGEGSTIKLSGADIVAESGDKNIINSQTIEMTGGSIQVKTGASLQISSGGNGVLTDGAFLMNGGELVNNGTLTIAVKDWVIEGDVTNTGLIQDNDGSPSNVVIQNDGNLTTSIWQDDFKINKVTVGEGGVFNITKLNSGGDKDNLEEHPHTRLLIAYNNEWTLADGDLQLAGETYTGDIKIGAAQGSSIGTGVLNVTAGEYKFSKVEFGSATENALNVTGGSLEIGELDATRGTTTIGESGTLSVDKINLEGVTGTTVSVEGTLKTTSDQAFTVGNGVLFAETEETAADATEVVLKTGIAMNGGKLALTDTGYYTSGSLAEMSEALKSDSMNGTLVILNAHLAAGEDGQIVDGFEQANVDATVTDKADDAGVVTITPSNAGVQSVTVTSENAQSLAVGKAETPATFTLTGSAAGGQLVKNDAGEALSVSVASGSTLSLGSSAIESETKGSLGTLEVSGTTSVVNMAAEIKDLTLNETGKVTVGNDSHRGALDVDSLSMTAGSSIFLDPAFFGTVADASHFGVLNVTDDGIVGEIVAGQNAIVSLGATSAEGSAAVNTMLESNGLAWGTDITSAVYVGSAVTIAESGYVVADGSLTSEGDNAFTSATNAGYSAGTLSVADKGLLAAKQGVVSGDEVLINGEVSFAQGSTLAIVNATEGEFNLAKDVTGEANVITDNPFYEAQLSNGKVVTSQDTANGVSSIASAGLQAMTRRADFVLSQTVADRASIDQELQPGVNLWVDVSGENYQMDGMDYGAEFEADTFYGTFGGDVKLGDAYTVGAAFQYGDGSLRSSVNNIKNDVTNYGLALYGTAKFGDAKVVGELSYIWGENDISASQTALNQSVDTSIYSAGVTGMYELRAGGFSFVPSIGLRVSQLETDAMRVGDVSIEDQDQTLFQIPVALRINGADMNAGGWKLAPSFKIAYVPTFGDTEINVRNIEADVIDTSPVQMDLGLRAGTENLLLNAAFSLGAGKEGSSSIGGKIGLKYAF